VAFKIVTSTIPFLFSVYAAQRDSYNSKDMSSSNNALPNEGVGGSAAGAGEAAAPGPTGVDGSGSGNNSSGNNKNGHPAAGSGAASESAALTTDASRSSVGGATTITGIPSSSLHKASSASSNTFSSQLASGFHRNSIDLEEARNAGPYFDKAFSKNVTALLGKTAYLNCRVKNLGNKTVSCNMLPVCSFLPEPNGIEISNIYCFVIITFYL